MSLILDKDDSFLYLIQVHVGKAVFNKEKVLSEMSKFRCSLSYHWMKKIENENLTKSLALILITFLKYTENNDSMIRISSYGILGALLLSVSPYAPNHFITAFSASLQQVSVGPRVSVAIINIFVYLTRYVSAVRMTDFVSKIEVLPHFSADMSDALKNLPNIIPLMNTLPVQFHQNILRSLTSMCGRSPNANFVSAVSSLIKLNPEVLSRDLIQFLSGNSLDEASILLGPYVLSDDIAYDTIGEFGRNMFISLSIIELQSKNLNLTKFESACLCLSIYLKRIKGTDEYRKCYDNILSVLPKDMPVVYRVRLYLLPPREFSDLLEDSNDSDQLRAAKIRALAVYLNENELADADTVAELYNKFRNVENDLYTTLLESVAMCVSIFARRCNKKHHVLLIAFLLKRKGQNWVHDEALSKVIDSIDFLAFPQFEESALIRLMEFSLSLNDRLYKKAVESIIKFSSLHNLDILLEIIFKSDWFSENVIVRRFYLLSKLARVFCSSSLFSRFHEIAFEALTLFDSISVYSNIFSFLSYCPPKTISDSIRDISFSFIVKHYQAFSRHQMEGPLKKYQEPIQEKTFLENLDTDIVSNPLFSHRKALRHVKHCLQFLCKVPTSSFKDINVFFWICLGLVPVFDKMALEKATELFELKPDSFRLLYDQNLHILKTTSQDDVAASCMNLIIRSGFPIPQFVQDLAGNILRNNTSDNPDLIYLSFIIYDQVDHENAIQSIPTILERLSIEEKNSLLFKLLNVGGRTIQSLILPENSISLVNHAIELPDVYLQKVCDYIYSKSFSSWTIKDQRISKCLIAVLAKCSKITISDFLSMDELHWKFVLSNPNYFVIEPIIDFINNNRSFFRKIDVSSLFPPPTTRNNFTLEQNSQTLISSLSPVINKGVLTNEDSLLISFFSFSTTRIEDQLLLKYFNKFIMSLSIEVIIPMFRYARRMKYCFNINTFSQNPILYTDRVFPHYIALFSREGLINSFESSIKQKIEKKLGYPIDPNLFSLLLKDNNIFSLIDADPNYFLHFFENPPQYKAKFLLSVIKLMKSSLICFDLLLKLISAYLPLYNQVESVRKKCVLMRFVNELLVYIDPKSKEYGELITIIGSNLSVLMDSMIPSNVLDFSIMLQALVQYLNDSSSLFRFLSKQTVNQKVTQPFLSLHSYCSSVLKKNTSLMNITQIETLFDVVQPSVIMKILHSLRWFLRDDNVYSVHFIRSLLPKINSILPFIVSNIGLAKVFSEFVYELLKNPNCECISKDFFQKIFITFLSDQKSAHFQSFLINAPLLTPYVPKIYDYIYSCTLNLDSFYLVLEEVYHSVLQSVGDEKMKVSFQAETMDRLINIFVQEPSIRVGVFMLQLMLQTLDPDQAFLVLFAKLSTKVPYFIQLYTILARFIRITGTSIHNEDLPKIEYPNSRELSMKMIKDDVSIGFLYAGIESNDVSPIQRFLESHNK